MTLSTTTRLQRALIYFFALFLIASCSTNNKTVKIYFEDEPKIQFAVEEVFSALKEKGFETEVVQRENADVIINVQTENPDLKPQGFSIKTGK